MTTATKTTSIAVTGPQVLFLASLILTYEAWLAEDPEGLVGCLNTARGLHGAMTQESLDAFVNDINRANEELHGKSQETPQ